MQDWSDRWGSISILYYESSLAFHSAAVGHQSKHKTVVTIEAAGQSSGPPNFGKLIPSPFSQPPSCPAAGLVSAKFNLNTLCRPFVGQKNFLPPVMARRSTKLNSILPPAAQPAAAAPAFMCLRLTHGRALDLIQGRRRPWREGAEPA
jgi:hypothetical protein